LIADKFNKFFANIASEIDQPLQQPVLEPTTFLNMSHPIISQDIIDVIKQLKHKHSLDPYNLSTVLVNLSLSTGEVPLLMKTAKVVHIFKSGDPTDVNNY
jgi:hypothetical protein